MMQVLRYHFFILFFPVILFVACTTVPQIMVFSAKEGKVYFIPPTKWTTVSKDIAELDITYRSGADVPATVNISFMGKKTAPYEVTYVALNGAGIEYPLSNIKVLYEDSKKRELRVTTEGDRDTLVSVLAANPVTLTAEVDGVLYTYTPHEDFIVLKDDFVITFSNQFNNGDTNDT